MTGEGFVYLNWNFKVRNDREAVTYADDSLIKLLLIIQIRYSYFISN